MGINDSGQVVGWYSDASGVHSFLLSGGNYIPLDVPGLAVGINDSGQVVGDGGHYGFLLSGGSYTWFDGPPIPPIPSGGTSFEDDTAPMGINDSGQVVGLYGYSYILDTGINTGLAFFAYGFLLSGGSYTRLDVPGAEVHPSLWDQ